MNDDNNNNNGDDALCYEPMLAYEALAVRGALAAAPPDKIRSRLAATAWSTALAMTPEQFLGRFVYVFPEEDFAGHYKTGHFGTAVIRVRNATGIGKATEYEDAGARPWSVYGVADVDVRDCVARISAAMAEFRDFNRPYAFGGLFGAESRKARRRDELQRTMWREADNMRALVNKAIREYEGGRGAYEPDLAVS